LGELANRTGERRERPTIAPERVGGDWQDKTEMKPTLEDAIRLAVEAHQNQRDRYGQPYVLHPLRVMFRLDNERDRVVGVLHDVIEDTRYTVEDLRGMGYSDEVLEALDSVTKREGEAYEDFVLRSRANPIGRRVKLADLEDNMDVRRMAEIGVPETERLARYRKAWSVLRPSEPCTGRTES